MDSAGNELESSKESRTELRRRKVEVRGEPVYPLSVFSSCSGPLRAKYACLMRFRFCNFKNAVVLPHKWM
jgi:hypothetical protein